MDELEQIPEMIAQKQVEPVQKTQPKTQKRKRVSTEKTTSEKAKLIERYLTNFDSTKDVPPTETALKRMSVATLKQKVKLQEQQKTRTVVKPNQLGERLIGLVSALLDSLLRTEGEIAKINERDEELIRSCNEELGVLSTLLSNKVQILGHLVLNSGKAYVKKRRLKKNEPRQQTQMSSKPE